MIPISPVPQYVSVDYHAVIPSGAGIKQADMGIFPECAQHRTTLCVYLCLAWVCVVAPPREHTRTSEGDNKMGNHKEVVIIKKPKNKINNRPKQDEVSVEVDKSKQTTRDADGVWAMNY
jgi:hypothetical protein